MSQQLEGGHACSLTQPDSSPGLRRLGVRAPLTAGEKGGKKKSSLERSVLGCDLRRRNLWFGCCSIDMEKMELRLAARKEELWGNHMTINLAGLEGEDEVRGEGGSGGAKPGKRLRELCWTQAQCGLGESSEGRERAWL